MKLKLLLFACTTFLFVSCKSDQKEKIKENTAISKSEEAKKEQPKTTADQIIEIKEHFAKIESEKKSFDKKIFVENESGGDTELIGYYKDNKPVKIKKSEFAGHGYIKTSYYFHENTLFFVYKQEYSEASVNGPYTGKETRLYIVNGELIQVLGKVKTVESGAVDMSNVKNENVTKNFKGSSIVADYIKEARKSSAKLLQAAIGLENGRWISKDDANAGIEIKDGKFIMFYKNGDKISNDIFNYVLSEHEGVEYMTLTNDKGEALKYSILEYTDDIFIISYLERGNRLSYVKEK